MKIAKGTDINTEWTGTIAVSPDNDTWTNIQASIISVYPSLYTEKGGKRRYQIHLRDGKDELFQFFLDKVTNQPTWTNDLVGLTQATFDITEWISLVVANTTELTNILLELQELNDNVTFKNKLLQVDKVGNVTYLGYAESGSGLGDAVWAIKKWAEVGQDAGATWADGDKEFDNIWDDRLTLTYS